MPRIFRGALMGISFRRKPNFLRPLGILCSYSPGGKKVHRARSGNSGATAPGSVCCLIIFTANPVIQSFSISFSQRHEGHKGLSFSTLCLCARYCITAGTSHPAALHPVQSSASPPPPKSDEYDAPPPKEKELIDHSPSQSNRPAKHPIAPPHYQHAPNQ